MGRTLVHLFCSTLPSFKSQKSHESGVSEIFIFSVKGLRCLFGVYCSLLCIQKRESVGLAGIFLFITDLPFSLSMLTKISPDSIEKNNLNAIQLADALSDQERAAAGDNSQLPSSQRLDPDL